MPTELNRAAALPAVHQGDGHERDGHVDGGDEGEDEGLGLVEAHGLPQRVGVVEDHVDAHEHHLLERGQGDPDPGDGLESEQRVLGGRRRTACARRPATGGSSRWRSRDWPLPAPWSALAGPPARGGWPPGSGATWMEIGTYQATDRRDDLHQEHPTPGLQAPDPGRGRGARSVGDGLVDEPGGDEDPAHDREPAGASRGDRGCGAGRSRRCRPGR